VRYSVYSRTGNPRTQTDEDTRKIAESSVLRGYAPQGSDIPTVQAWPGTIPTGEYGLEFETTASPAPRSAPGVPIWRAGTPGVRVGSDERGPYAEITIRVTRVVLSAEVER
jgi:hypothetical protein